jgi:hypothetical protein
MQPSRRRRLAIAATHADLGLPHPRTLELAMAPQKAPT